jgi:outer membrane receptor protein involved in Fe transport
MSGLENYDLRVDYAPYAGGLWSASVFHKEIENPIEYTQRVVGFIFTTPANYPEGELSGFELEARQSLGRFSEKLEGLSVGANATFIDGTVQLPDDEILVFQDPNIMVPITERDMTNAPEHLYNLYLLYDHDPTGWQAALFYTVKGDTLVAGPGTSAIGNFLPSVYSTEYGTLNFSLSRRIGKHLKLQFQAKNLTNPEIEEVYRSDVTGGDVTKTSYTRGSEYAIGISINL